MEFDLSRFQGPCTCGRTHEITVRGIWIAPGALHRLPELAAENGWNRPAIICDRNTWDAAGQRAARLLNAQATVLEPNGLHADEHGVEAARETLPDADVLIAAGAGTIHDITRFLAHERKLPFVAAPTAASVDGFVSTVAAMTWHGCKKTMPAVAPLYVVADSDIFAKAPLRLTASGFADLLGKYTALADWRLAQLAAGEFLCERVCGMEMAALRETCGVLDSIRRGEPAGCEQLMQGLLLSGLAMQMVGNSRPASGAEHHMSHLWEMAVINPPLDAYHGEKVGVGTLLVAREYHAFGDALRSGRVVPAAYHVERELLAKYFQRPGMLAEIMDENTPDPLMDVDAAAFLNQKEKILEILDALPAQAKLKSFLEQAGAKSSLADIGLGKEIVEPTARLSPYVRNRLTMMRIRKLFQIQ